MTTQEDRAPLPTEISTPEPEVDPQVSGRNDSGSGGSEPSEADAAPDERLAIGQKLSGRYRIERELGEGGMGVVYLVSDEQVAGETFAVKVLKEGLDPEALGLLREEVRKTRKLSHPNIVDVHSVNVDGTRLYVLMEYLEGKSLNALLDEEFGRGMTFSHAWPIIEDVGAALGYAHDHNVIHSDLKPANVFLTNSGRTKLLDFGIARASRGPLLHQCSGPLALTPAYASCEMLEGEEADARDDIYSFACVIYEMLCGKRPFGELTALEARDTGAQVPPLGVLSRKQNAVLAHGLAFDRKGRTSSVERLLEGVADSKPRTRPIALLTGAVIATVAALSLTYLALDKLGVSRRSVSVQQVASEKSMAVLPFVDLSEKHDQEYFGDGMAEEIINLLAKIPVLTVIGRTSSFQFKGRNEDIRTIGSKLNAAHVLEGSVRNFGDRVRITAQLINTRTGTHEWSESYDREIGDVLKLQDAIAAAVVREMQLTVAPGFLENRSTLKSTEAYDLMLRGRHAADRSDKEGLDEAVTLFKRALDLDPTSAEVAAELAFAYESQAEEYYVLPTAAFEEARRTANVALKLDWKSARAHYVLGLIDLYYGWQWDAARQEFQQVATLAPGSADALIGQGELFLALGRWDDALRETKAALAQDPVNPTSFYYLSELQLRRGELAEAESAMRTALDIRPTYDWAHWLLGVVLLARGQHQAAIQQMQQVALDDGRESGLAIVYHALGRKPDSDSSLARLLKDQTASPYLIANVYAFRGESDEAMRWLERAYVQKDSGLIYLKVEWPLRSLQGDARFKAFLRKMNLPE